MKSTRGHAIIIGVNEINVESYRGSGTQYRRVACPENNAQMVVDLAKGTGFTSIQHLHGQFATHEKVQHELLQAADDLQAGDLLLLYFSGHGGQVKDLDFDEEPDGLDETWCLYDGHFLDDALYASLKRFKPGIRIVLVNDCCHAAGNRRSVEMWEPNPDLPVTRGFDAPTTVCRPKRTKQTDDAVSAAVIFLAACRENQLAFCSTSPVAPSMGRFTKGMLDVLGDTSFQGNYVDLMEQLRIRGFLPFDQTHEIYTLGPEAEVNELLTAPAFQI